MPYKCKNCKRNIYYDITWKCWRHDTPMNLNGCLMDEFIATPEHEPTKKKTKKK